MSGIVRETPWDVSPEVRAAAKTRLPLRLPPPEKTGPQGRRIDSAAARETSPAMRPRNRRVAMPLSDVELEAMAQKALLHSGVRGFTKLHAEVRDGVATLYGTLPTEFERQIAVQLVQRVNGLSGVEHEISIVETRPTSALPVRRAPLKRRALAMILATIGGAVLIGGCWWGWRSDTKTNSHAMSARPGFSP